MHLAFRLACVVLGLPFIWLGYEAAIAPGARVAMAARLRIPRPDLAVRFNGAAMVAGGLGVATGLLWQAAALGLVLSLILTTLAGHAFWTQSDAQARKANRIQFLKNLGLIGGLLAVALAPYLNG